MQERERELQRQDPGAGASAADDPLASARADAERLLQAADEAIARALSADSQAFLLANQQSVGQ
jgi:hypothetical protein